MAQIVEKAQEANEFPGTTTLSHACKLAVQQDKPILLDYWEDSVKKNVFFGLRSNEEKLLVRSEDEYTSPISKIYKVESDLIVLTENSIYIVSVNCPTKRIT
tara:strand:+ start:35887 stop:36192 length:306 start_codon:yes stop_codon:yes gene_type:complete